MKLTDKEQFQIKILLGRSLYLGAGISLLLKYGDKDAYLAIILGFLIGIPIIYIYSHLSINSPWHDYLKQNNILNIIIKFLLTTYYLFIIFLLIIIFAIFIFSFYLPFTNTIISCTPFLFLAVYLSTKKTKGIARIAKILFFINIALLAIKYTMLIPHLDFLNFAPIYTLENHNLFITATLFAILTTSPYLLLLDQKCSFKTNIKAYIGNAFIIGIMLFYLIGCFGGPLAKSFSYPEFSILRQINVFNFIQNIESFLAINWLFDIFIALSIACQKIKNICNYQNNLFTYLIVFILIYLANKFIISNYVNTMFTYHYFVIFLIVFSLLIYLFLGIKKGLSKPKSNEIYK